MQSAFAKVNISAPRTVRPTRCTRVCAAVDRRQAFGVLAAGLLVALAPPAEAITIAAQESRKGTLPKNTSEASSSSYTMEGIKKNGASPKRRSELMAAAKKNATAGKF